MIDTALSRLVHLPSFNRPVLVYSQIHSSAQKLSMFLASCSPRKSSSTCMPCALAVMVATSPIEWQMSLRTLVECSDSGQAGAVAVICRRSDLDDGVVGSRCVGTEGETKVLSSGRNCACDAIGRIGGDVVAVSWSLSCKSVGLNCPVVTIFSVVRRGTGGFSNCSMGALAFLLWIVELAQ